MTKGRPVPDSPQETRNVDLSRLRIDRSASAPPAGAGMRRLLFGLLALALLVSLAALVWRFAPSVTGALEVRVATARVVSAARAGSVLTASGYLVSRTQAAIGSKASGRVEEIRVEEGDPVERNAVLAVLEHADIAAGLSAARAARARANADVAEVEAVLAEDERDVVRKKALFEEAIGPREDWERAEARRDASRARLEALREQVTYAEALIREAEERLENMFIRAPFSGTVISKDAEVGETITPGGMGAASGRGSVVTLADLEHLEVETDVKEDYIGRLRVGQPARIEVDAVPGRAYQGRLRQIIPMGDRSRAVIQVKVEVLDADQALFPEMSASVHFLPDGEPALEVEPKPQVFVPATAVTRMDGRSVVFVVQDERARLVPVEIGATRDNLVEVVDGLAGGESVVLAPSADLADGMKVKVGEG
jgi:RND family efflux transporter MFP subunit